MVCGVFIGHVWCFLQPDPPQKIYVVYDFTGVAEQFIKDRESKWDEATDYHGELRNYAVWDGKLWIVEGDQKIDVVETMRGVEK